MKTPLYVLLALAATCAVAMQTPAYFQGPDRIASINTTVQHVRKLTRFIAQVQCVARITNLNDPRDGSTRAVTDRSLTIDFIRDGAKTIVVDGETYTYREVADVYVAICQTEWAAKHPPVFSANKRFLREPPAKVVQNPSGQNP